MEDFLASATETEVTLELHDDLHTYILYGEAARTTNEPLISIQEFFSLVRATHTEQSQVVYLEVMDAVADTKDTMMQLLHDLHEQFIVSQNMKWLVLEGDAKLYEIVKSLQFEYGDELSWLIPYRGDWHMLMNYQSALMKPYYDAGLKALASSAGHPLTAIQNSSQFKRSHNFILEVWEAMYRVMLQRYLEQSQDPAEILSPGGLIEDIVCYIQTLPIDDLSCSLTRKLHQQEHELHFSDFKSFIQNRARTDDTWKFWIQLVFQDVMAYIGLFLAIRSGDWQLRMASMKLMAPTFTAFDHPTYQKLISQHLADLLSMPAPIITMFVQGAFVVSILGRSWHSVAIDESHEMMINKDCKTSIVRPIPDYITRFAKYIPYRSKSIKKTLQKQLFPTSKTSGITTKSTTKSLLSSKPDDIKAKKNIAAIIKTIQANNLFQLSTDNCGLINPFTKKVATQGQQHDLLTFRSIGQQEFLLRISYVILKKPSVKAPNRRRRLVTFTERKVNKSRISQLERDKKLILSAMKRKMQFSRRIGAPIERPGEQLLELPLAISDNDGNPLKGEKSYTSRSLEARYKSATPAAFTTDLPWTPECSLIEGMFIINTTPLGHHKSLGNYASFLLKRFILTQFRRGCQEVHVVFDNPGRLKTHQSISSIYEEILLLKQWRITRVKNSHK